MPVAVGVSSVASGALHMDLYSLPYLVIMHTHAHTHTQKQTKTQTHTRTHTSTPTLTHTHTHAHITNLPKSDVTPSRIGIHVHQVLLGALTGMAYIRSGTLLVPIVMHCLHNTLELTLGLSRRQSIHVLIDADDVDMTPWLPRVR
jgi:hypothetical protein